MTNREGWKTKLIWLVIGMALTLIGDAIFSFLIVPYITDKPEIELLVVEPKLFHQGDLIELNTTLENTGKKTASDLLIYVIEQTEIEDHQSGITNKPSILQAGDKCNAIFSLNAPESNQPQWRIQLWVTTTNGYFWKFDIVYEFLADTHQYHLISWD